MKCTKFNTKSSSLKNLFWLRPWKQSTKNVLATVLRYALSLKKDYGYRASLNLKKVSSSLSDCFLVEDDMGLMATVDISIRIAELIVARG